MKITSDIFKKSNLFERFNTHIIFFGILIGVILGLLIYTAEIDMYLKILFIVISTVIMLIIKTETYDEGNKKFVLRNGFLFIFTTLIVSEILIYSSTKTENKELDIIVVSETVYENEQNENIAAHRIKFYNSVNDNMVYKAYVDAEHQERIKHLMQVKKGRFEVTYIPFFYYEKNLVFE